MDLRTFFGDWRVDQPILIRQGETEYFALVDQFTHDQIIISADTQAETNSFYFSIKREANTYALKLYPGSGLVPSYFDGGDLEGTTVIGSSLPSSLIVQGPFRYSSRTLSTRVIGNMTLSRAYAHPEQSTLTLNIFHPKLEKAPIEFYGEL